MVNGAEYDKTIDVLFKQAVEQYPDHIAVIGTGYELTYRELDEQTDRLAAFLRVEYGAKPEGVVGIFMERCEVRPGPLS